MARLVMMITGDIVLGLASLFLDGFLFLVDLLVFSSPAILFLYILYCFTV